MIPYRLLFNIGSKAAGTFMQRRKEKSDRKHAIALAEMETEEFMVEGLLFLQTLL